MSATVNVLDICDGLRDHIKQGLSAKGIETNEYYLSPPADTISSAGTPSAAPKSQHWHLPPQKLVEVLLEAFYERLYDFFPVITYVDMQHLYHSRLLTGDADPDLVPLLYALLAVAALMVDRNHPVFSYPECQHYDNPDLAVYFYALARQYLEHLDTSVIKIGPLEASLVTERNSIYKVTAWTLISMYLASSGSDAAAWVIIGKAIRLGQDLGLHRCPEKLHLPHADRRKRRCLWFCLYVLDRMLSMSLGRPPAINELDADTTVPQPASMEHQELACFFALVQLHQLSSEGSAITRSFRGLNPSRMSSDAASLHAQVQNVSNRLKSWAATTVPPHIRNASMGRSLAQRSILLSSFFATIMALWRPFMTNPHRESPFGTSEVATQVARAAINCITSSSSHLACIPVSVFSAFHGQQIFVASVLLMHCMRISEDEVSVTNCLGYVDIGKSILDDMQDKWQGAPKARAVVDEFLSFTLGVLQSERKGICNFSHGTHAENAHTGHHASRIAKLQNDTRSPCQSDNQQPYFKNISATAGAAASTFALRSGSPPSPWTPTTNALLSLQDYLNHTPRVDVDTRASQSGGVFDVGLPSGLDPGSGDADPFDFDLAPFTIPSPQQVQLGGIRPNVDDVWDVFQ